MGVEVRKKNVLFIKEVFTGFIGKIWDIEEKFNIDRRVVYVNYKYSKLIGRNKYKGLNFIKL